jgi:hypothetical protein
VTIFFRGGPTIQVPSITDAPPPTVAEFSAGQGLDPAAAGQDFSSCDADDEDEDEDWQDDAGHGHWQPAVGDAVTAWPLLDESGKSIGYLVAPA